MGENVGNWSATLLCCFCFLVCFLVCVAFFFFFNLTFYPILFATCALEMSSLYIKDIQLGRLKSCFCFSPFVFKVHVCFTRMRLPCNINIPHGFLPRRFSVTLRVLFAIPNLRIYNLTF